MIPGPVLKLGSVLIMVCSSVRTDKALPWKFGFRCFYIFKLFIYAQQCAKHRWAWFDILHIEWALPISRAINTFVQLAGQEQKGGCDLLIGWASRSFKSAVNRMGKALHIDEKYKGWVWYLCQIHCPIWWSSSEPYRPWFGLSLFPTSTKLYTWHNAARQVLFPWHQPNPDSLCSVYTVFDSNVILCHCCKFNFTCLLIWYLPGFSFFPVTKLTMLSSEAVML